MSLVSIFCVNYMSDLFLLIILFLLILLLLLLAL
jgi:hypothetical protein